MKYLLDNPFRPLIAMVMMLIFDHSAAQTTTEKPNPYYININHATSGRVYEIQDEVLNLRYDDRHGQRKEIPLKIYNWRQELVVSADLGKAFGANYFVVPLKEFYAGWETGKIYIAELSDESGRKYKLPFRPVAAPETEGPEVDILVNPITLTCEDLSASVVEFFGNIKGGKAPYTINWVVTNNERTDLLYQPKEESIRTPGRTAQITVDATPDYYVLLQVKDACGNTVQKMVHMICDDKKKKINTLFVEPLNLDPTIKRKIR